MGRKNGRRAATRDAARGVAAALCCSWALAVAAIEPAASCGAPGPRLMHGELAGQLPLIAPRAIAWAETVAGRSSAIGEALPPSLQDLARRVGVKRPAQIRLAVVDEIPLPEEPLLKAAAAKAGLVPSSAGGMTLGYAVVVRRGYETDIRLLSHEFRHVAQYEACGGIAPFLSVHLGHLAEFGYHDSPFEADARAHEVLGRRPHGR